MKVVKVKPGLVSGTVELDHEVNGVVTHYSTTIRNITLFSGDTLTIEQTERRYGWPWRGKVEKLFRMECEA